jgi:hypothetical protein
LMPTNRYSAQVFCALVCLIVSILAHLACALVRPTATYRPLSASGAGVCGQHDATSASSRAIASTEAFGHPRAIRSPGESLVDERKHPLVLHSFFYPFLLERESRTTRRSKGHCRIIKLVLLPRIYRFIYRHEQSQSRKCPICVSNDFQMQ